MVGDGAGPAFEQLDVDGVVLMRGRKRLRKRMHHGLARDDRRSFRHLVRFARYQEREQTHGTAWALRQMLGQIAAAEARPLPDFGIVLT